MRTFNVAYFTASCDTVETNKKFAESLSLDYPILSDPDCKVAAAYGVKAPDRNMSLRYTVYIGKDGKIAYIDRKVNAGAHGEDVAKKLGELGVDKQ